MKTRSGKDQRGQSIQHEAIKPSTLADVCDHPRIFVLPKNTTSDARIVTISNPVSGSLYRYYFCPVKGVYEFIKIAAPKGAPRSWLLAPRQRDTSISDGESTPNEQDATLEGERSSLRESPRLESKDRESTTSTPVTKGYVLNTAELFLATPLDPMFLVLSALVEWTSTKDGAKRLFLSADDHFDALVSRSKSYSFMLKHKKFRDECERRLEAICDTVPAGDENMYGLSYDKLFVELYSKATRMSVHGLPASMEEHFVRKALELPETPTLETAEETDASMICTDAQDVDTCSSTAETSGSSVATTWPGATYEGKVPQLLRLRTAFNFLLESYVPVTAREEMLSMLQVRHLVDFKIVDEHMSRIASLRSEALALRSLSNNISRKRGYDCDDETAENEAQKKQRKLEEERKKKSESRGVRDLKKVDTSGMKKLSSFFAKASARKPTADAR